MGNEYYYLFLVFATSIENEEGAKFLSNKQFVHRCSLEGIDELTSGYRDAQDLAGDWYPGQDVDSVVNAIIISERAFQELKKNGWITGFVRTMPVLFGEDKDFLEQQIKGEMAKYTYDNNLIEKYKNYLLNHRREISVSLVRKVPLGVEINASITKVDMDRVFLAYYKNRGYSKMRETYFELKKLGVIKSTRQALGAKKQRKKTE